MTGVIVGIYQRVSTENYGELLKELNVNPIMRKAATSISPIMEVEERNGHWAIMTGCPPSGSVEIDFELGVEFDETTADGREVTSLMELKGNILSQTQTSKTGSRNSTVIREFLEDTVKVTYKVDGWALSCVQIYERIE